jgi:hypothetical protein
MAQKWEYARLTSAWDGAAQRDFLFYNGAVRPYSELDEILNEFGDKGWELVSTMTTGGGDLKEDTLIFKRPKL